MTSNSRQDLPTIVGIVLLLSTFVIVANIVVDILYAFIDRGSGWTEERSMSTTEKKTTSMPSDPSDSYFSVRDLVVHFPTSDGIVKATDGLSYEVQRGKTLGIVGESGSGKSVSSSAILGLHRAPTPRSAARSCWTASTCSSSPTRRCGAGGARTSR